MRNPNGYGTIRKLTGKRKRPFGVYVTTGYETYHAVPSIDFLEDILSEPLYEDEGHKACSPAEGCGSAC